MRYPHDSVQSSGKSADTPVVPRVTFTSYEFVAAKPTLENTKMTKGASGDSVCLYLPNGFSEKYSANWSETEIVTSLLGTDLSGSLDNAIGSTLKGVTAGTAGTDAIAAAVRMGQSQAGGIVNSAMYGSGLTPFPGQFNMFSKGNPIDMDFTFDMIPRSSGEGDSIVQICTHFKSKILATYGAGNTGISQYMLTFPDIWRISFTGINGVGFAGDAGSNEYLNMALVNCNVAYSGGANSALTFHDKNPVVVTLSLSFKGIMPSYKGGK